MGVYEKPRDGWSAPPRVGEKLKGLKHEEGGPTLTVELFASNREDRRHDGVTPIQNIGFSEDFIKSELARTFRINIKNGFPVLGEGEHPESITFGIKGEMASYTILASEPESFILVCVGTTSQTFYLALSKGKKAAYFYTAFPSYHGRHAIRGLLHFNLLNGPKAYNRTANLVPQFFKRALSAVYTQVSVIHVTISVLKQGEGRENYREYTAKYHLNPNNRRATILSIEGYCFDVDLDVYPRMQLVTVDQWAMNNTPEIRRDRQAKRNEKQCTRLLSQVE